MDVESEFSVLESGETRTISASGKLGNVDETKIHNNESCGVENNDKNEFLDGMKGKRIEVNSPTLEVTSQVPSSPVMIKGNGLRKWRRIRRDANKGRDNIVDTGKMLTESLPNSGANSTKRMQFSEEMKQKSKGYVSSTNAERNLNGFVVLGDSGLVIGPTLFARMDSENSGDLSSKSSTAASAPNSRYEMSKVAGIPQDKIRTTSLSEKNLSNSVQRDQQRKGHIDTSKKVRGRWDRDKIEKDNSHSSVESDSRSSNFSFMQGTYSAMSNGLQNGSSVDYDAENGDDSSLEVKEERSENSGSAADHDSLVESLSALQSAREALEREVKKFREIGKEDFHFDDSIQDLPSEYTSTGPELYQTNSAEQVQSSVDALNKKKAKQSQLETILNSKSKEKRDIEAALEDLFKRRIEAEVEYFITSRMIQKSNIVVDEQSLLEKQKTLASKQAQMLNRLEDAENKAATLNKEAENLENYCEDIVSADENMTLQKRVWKYIACFFLQLVILIIIMGLFILQISPNYTGSVPT